MGLKPITTMSTTHLSPAREKLAELFGVDFRSLAAFRMAVGLVLLSDLWFRGQELSASGAQRSGSFPAGTAAAAGIQAGRAGSGLAANDTARNPRILAGHRRRRCLGGGR